MVKYMYNKVKTAAVKKSEEISERVYIATRKHSLI